MCKYLILKMTDSKTIDMGERQRRNADLQAAPHTRQTTIRLKSLGGARGEQGVGGGRDREVTSPGRSPGGLAAGTDDSQEVPAHHQYMAALGR